MTRIAIMSDSHDNIWNLALALDQIREANADMLLHCGDFVAPFIMPQLGEGFTGPIHGVLGNNDGDPRLIAQQAAQWDHLTIHGQFVELEIDGCRIAMNHYPEIAHPLAESGRYDLVCYGHNHLQNWEQVNQCHLINPGEIMGRLGVPSWGLFDTTTRTWILHPLQS